MPELDAVGEAVTGGMLGRAVEPRTGELDDGHTHEQRCLNCRSALAGDYCHVCGQRAHVHRTIGAWWHDFLHSVLHLDGKFWRTLPMLAWRPGELTRRYAHGERARFISPLALFLFTVFLMFAVFSLSGASTIGTDAAEQASAELSAELRDSRSALGRLRQQRSEAEAAGTETAALDEQIEKLEAALADPGAVVAAGSSGQLIDTDIETGWQWLDKGIEKANSNPALMFYKLQANAYKFSWALIPISVPFVWALFLNRRRYRRQFTGYDHLVFATYSIAFMSLWLVAIVMLNSIGIDSPLIDTAFLLIPPIHIYRQLRGAYALSRLSAAWRTLALVVFANLALTLFLLLLLAIGVLG